MSIASLRDSVRHTLNTLNPLYRNPIQSMPDFQHLDGRVELLNPHLDRQCLLRVMVLNQHVADAVRDLDGEFCLEAALVEGELRVNVFEIEYRRSETHHQPLFNANWRKDRAMRYLLAVEDRRAEISIIEGPRVSCYIDPHAPRHSWTIPLDGNTKVSLGLKISG